MEQKIKEKKILIIKKLSKIKNISFQQAKQLFETLENYCELIINYTLKNRNERE
jgi:hypothetical protein